MLISDFKKNIAYLTVVKDKDSSFYVLYNSRKIFSFDYYGSFFFFDEETRKHHDFPIDYVIEVILYGFELYSIREKYMTKRDQMLERIVVIYENIILFICDVFGKSYTLDISLTTYCMLPTSNNQQQSERPILSRIFYINYYSDISSLIKEFEIKNTKMFVPEYTFSRIIINKNLLVPYGRFNKSEENN